MNQINETSEIERQLRFENSELHHLLLEKEQLINDLQSNAAKIKLSNGIPANSPISLANSGDPFCTIVEDMNEGACTLSEKNVILYCNKSFSDFLSIDKEKIIGLKISKLIPENDKIVAGLLAQTRTTGRGFGEITYMHHVTGLRYFFLSLKQMTSNLKGDLFIIVTDITEIKLRGIENEKLLIRSRLAAMNIMEDEIESKKELTITNRKLVEEIRERKKVACAMNQSKQDLLQAQKMAHIGNWSFDLVTKHTSWSDEIGNILELPLNKHIIGFEEFKNYIHPDDWQKLITTIQHSTEQGIPAEFELRIFKTNGEDATVYVICTPQLNSLGVTVKLNGIIQDITERKQSENELIKLNHLYTVISQVNQMIVRNRIREDIFSEACNIAVDFGKFKMAWIGLIDDQEQLIKPVAWAGDESGFLNAIGPVSLSNDLHQNGPTCRAIRTGKYAYSNDLTNDPRIEPWRKELSERNYRSSIALPILVHEKIVGNFTIYVSEPFFFNQTEIDLLLQVTSDISFALEVAESERKRLEIEQDIKTMNAELEQRVSQRTQQLENINNELQAFAHSVSHDLRSPLNNINGWSNVLIDECRDQLGEVGVTYLDRVVSETKRMGQLIDDLLKLSRVTSGDQKRELVDITIIAENIIHRLKEKELPNPPETIVEPGLTTVGDSRLLEIALNNLLDNAFKFTSKQDAPKIEIGKSIIDGKITFWIKDNGIGFDMSHSKNLFGAFQRMHKQSDFPGIGIGLATVQRIIHRHNGHIWADSAINQGTTFYFTIPEELI